VFQRTRISLAALVLLTAPLALAACGSSQTPPAESAEQPAPASEEKAPEPAADKEAAAPAETKPAEPEGPQLSRSVLDTITEPDNGWVFNFQSSAKGEKAQADCEEKFKEKPKQKAQCLSKARSGFVADAMMFKKDKAGQDVWVIYKVTGSRVNEIYSIPVSYGEEKAGVLKVKKSGKAKGSAPILGGSSEFEVKLLSNYQMELDDSRHGKLIYDARIGFLSH
jgi:hypothetical protein